MIFKQISKISNAGVWKNFVAPKTLELAPRTLIFGFNGSGKTTLSRVFSSVMIGKIEDRLPRATEYKIEASEGPIITQESEFNHFRKNILVFNTDFVERNFRWEESHAEGIVYLSSKSIDAKKQLNDLMTELTSAQQQEERVRKENDTAEKNLKEFKTNVARLVREVAASRKYTQSYNAANIEKSLKANKFAKTILSEDDLRAKKSLLLQPEALAEITWNTSIPAGIRLWLDTSKSLLEKTIPQIAMEEFEAHASELRWAEQGLIYHEKYKLRTCLLCGNDFHDERRERLKKLFDKSWQDTTRVLEEGKRDGERYRDNLRNLYQAIPHESQFSAVDRKMAINLKKEMQDAISQLGIHTGNFVKTLGEKISSPTKASDLSNMTDFDFDVWERSYREIEERISGIIGKHNAESKGFTNLQKEAFSQLEAHVLTEKLPDWDRLQKANENSKTDLIATEKKRGDIEKQIVTVRNSLADHGAGAEKLNALILSYLGHNEIFLVAKDGGYMIRRASGEAATELSEGEKTALSFSFFLTQIAAEGRKAEEVIVVIDDPISSLDTSARTHAFSLMSRMIKKCAQVIILTHNASFMTMVKREFQSIQYRDKTKLVSSFLSIDCKGSGRESDRNATLIEMPSLLLNHDSEYHFLFDLVRKAAKEGETPYLFLLPNATRKLLEIFATFCSPDEGSFNGALGAHHEQVNGKLDIKALERLVQLESHGSMDGMGSPPDLTLENALSAAEAALKFIELVARDHFKRMERACDKDAGHKQKGRL